MLEVYTHNSLNSKSGAITVMSIGEVSGWPPLARKFWSWPL